MVGHLVAYEKFLLCWSLNGLYNEGLIDLMCACLTGVNGLSGIDPMWCYVRMICTHGGVLCCMNIWTSVEWIMTLCDGIMVLLCMGVSVCDLYRL